MIGKLLVSNFSGSTYLIFFVLVTTSAKTVPSMKIPESLFGSNYPMKLEYLGTVDHSPKCESDWQSGYWTSALESFTLPSMYVWNDTETHLDPSIIPKWDNSYYENLSPSHSTKTRMYTRPCSSSRSPLCQGEVSCEK